MKLHSIRGGNTTEMYEKAYNLAVPISLGNRWFTTDRIIDLIRYSLQYTNEYVIVYVADEIHAINIEVRSKRSREFALRKALMIGEEVLFKVKQRVNSDFNDTEKERVKFAKWSDFNTNEYSNKLQFLYKKYLDCPIFKKEVLNLVESSVVNESKVFSQEDKIRLGEYIIEELPELIVRVPIKGLIFDANVYPYDGRLLEFVEKIQKGVIFKDIKENILDTEPKVFIEVR